MFFKKDFIYENMRFFMGNTRKNTQKSIQKSRSFLYRKDKKKFIQKSMAKNIPLLIFLRYFLSIKGFLKKENTMEKTNSKNILFDLDGTILDTLPDLFVSANYALKKLGFPEQTFEDVRRAIGHGIRNLLRDLMKCNDTDTLEKCRMIFKDYYDKNKAVHTRPYDGMIELVQRLKSQGNKVFVISNKYDDAAKALVYNFYGDMFDGVYGSRDNILPKPDRAIFDIVVEENSLNPSDCIYVGDSEVDREFAENTGMDFVAVCWGFRTEEELRKCGAKTIVSDIYSLENELEKLM